MEELKIIPVTTRKERKEFVEYPLRLYKGNPYFVPPFYADEMNLFTSKNIYQKTCESAFFLAIRGKKTVGRIPKPQKRSSIRWKTGQGNGI